MLTRAIIQEPTRLVEAVPYSDCDCEGYLGGHLHSCQLKGKEHKGKGKGGFYELWMQVEHTTWCIHIPLARTQSHGHI